MGEVHAPFTPYYSFTGPNVAISCDVEWDDVDECYHAKNSVGFHGTGDSRHEAALACFQAWLTNRKGWFDANTK